MKSSFFHAKKVVSHTTIDVRWSVPGMIQDAIHGFSLVINP